MRIRRRPCARCASAECSSDEAHQSRKRADGRWDVTLDVDVFTAEPGRKDYSRNSILKMQTNEIRSGRQSISLVVDREPKFAGVDPYNKYVDRNSEDNVIGIEED